MDRPQLAYDIRHAVRRFRRAPAFTGTALSVLALGIAANVAVFSIANAVLLKAPAFPDPERLVFFGSSSPAGADVGASPAMYGHWRAQAGVVRDVTAFQHAPINDTTGGSPEQIQAGRVSAAYFRLFGAATARGRTFTEQEDRADGHRVVVVSHDFWTRRFGGPTPASSDGR